MCASQQLVWDRADSLSHGSVVKTFGLLFRVRFVHGEPRGESEAHNHSVGSVWGAPPLHDFLDTL